MRRIRVAFALLIAFATMFVAAPAVAGPPYVTDDPDPTDYRHWEIYAPGFTYTNAGWGRVYASLPFAEFNYGALPNIQVSVAFTQTDERLPRTNIGASSDHLPGTSTYAYNDTSFGIKYRFVQETAGRPQISFYPSVDIPATGGHAVLFLPVWLQKTTGPWTAFGGGGVYVNPGPVNRDYSFVGGALTRTISSATSIGAELFHQGADTIGGSDTTGANLGLVSQVGAYHALLFSFGRSLAGPPTFSAYAAYEFALGPTNHAHP